MRRFQRKTREMGARSLGGLKAKRNGADAEGMVEMIANVYLHEGKAEICKRHEPYRRVSSGKKAFKAVYAGKSGCDYEIWLRDGSSGHIELKSREGVRINKNAIDSSQAEQLTRRVKWNQIAWIIVRLKGEWFRVEWEKWDSGTRKSHNRTQLEEIGSCVPLKGGLPDILFDYV